MKAIVTKYHGPTDHQGSRIVASDDDGNRFVLKEFGQLSHDDAHETAAYGLCKKMNWSGGLVAGGFKNAMYWVFIPETFRKVKS